VNLGLYGGIHLRASGKNCDSLMSIYEKYIKPSIAIGLSVGTKNEH
jgi:hypothetical protein